MSIICRRGKELLALAYRMNSTCISLAIINQARKNALLENTLEVPIALILAK